MIHAYLALCVLYLTFSLICRSSGLAFWRVDNSLGTFLPADPGTLSVIGRAYELRHILFGFRGASSKSLKDSNIQTMSSEGENVQRERSSITTSGWRFQAVASFRLIWWNQDSKSSKKLSIWRPIIPEGMVYFGDIAVRGYVIFTFWLSLLVSTS